MSRRMRVAVIILGLLIICLSLVVLGYAFWPVEGTQVQATLEPTLFWPP